MRGLKGKLKYFAVTLLFVLTSGASSLAPVYATSSYNPYNNKKYFVCKYVGTPGVNERLQTGQNPISVSENAIGENPVVVGSYFKDGQYRSFVLAEDYGQPDPSVSACPAPQGPTKIAIPAPTPVDPCGLYNAYWVKPADTDQLDWSLSYAGVLSVHTKTGYVFTDGTTSKNFGTAQDSNTPCVQQVPVPAAPSVTDPCGPSNATWIKPSDSASVTWTLTNGDLVATTKAGYVFADGSTTHDYGTAQDSNVPCTVGIPAAPSVTDPCGPSNATWIKPSDSATITWSITQSGHLIATTTAGNVFTDGHTTHDYGVANDSNTPCLIQVTPPVVTFSDVCGAVHDTFTVPSKTGVVYKINGYTVWPGTYPGSGTVTVTAVAANGYVLTGTTTWTNTFNRASCKVTFCHANAFDSDDWGWTKVTIDDDGAFSDWLLWGHAAHDDADIMPSFTYFDGTHFAGKNLATNYDGFTGQQILDNDCKKPCPKPVTPAVVTFTDPTCEYPKLGSYTVPTTPHVVYKVGNTVVTGTNSVTVPGSVTVKAYPESGAYVLSGTTTWAYNFVAPSDCGGGQEEPTVVSPDPVTFTDPTCTVNGFYTIPSTEGVLYEDGDGNVITAGDHAVLPGQTVTVYAYAADGYVLDTDGTPSWTHTFVAASNCGHVLGDTTSTPAGPSTTGKVLADTGTSVVAPTILAISLALTATGVMFGSYMQRKRASSDPTL